MKIIDGGIVAPIGFKATGGHVGLKKMKKDLCLVKSEVEAEFAGCFTKNIVKAAPVLWDMKIAKNKNKVKGFVVNSGNANACTGEKGIEDNYIIAKTFAQCLDASPEEILVCSTGVIGVPLQIEKVENGINNLYKDMDSTVGDGILAAEAILTTDTFVKTIAVEVNIAGKPVKIGGMAKGSGMIHPNMATMLSFITTDVAMSHEMLDKAIKDSTVDTYNMISVDADTSTNDTLIILANAMAENKKIISAGADYDTFKNALDFVNRKLAIDIVKDGEGATKLMEVTAYGAKTKTDAKKIVKSVISSSLFKAALFGSDANWGRVLCAMGYSEADFDPSIVTIVFKSKNKDNNYNEVTLMKKGAPVSFDEELAKNILDCQEVFVDIFLEQGNETATGWGCDLTYDYVKINGDYRS